MTVTETRGTINLNIPGLTRPVRDPGARSAGLHCSDIVRNYGVLTGKLDMDAVIFGHAMYEPIDEYDLPLAIAMGLAWENFLEPQYPDMFRPGEISKDDIQMNPDGMSYGNHPSASEEVHWVDEIKLTWKTMNKPLAERYLYLMQCKAYCYALETNYCRLHVLYVNGNYRFGNDPNGGPQYVIYWIYFPDHELEGNWSTMNYYREITV